MKKGTKLVALLLGLALVIPACTSKPVSSTPAESTPSGESTSADSSEPGENYTITISNKEELQAEWFVGDPSRKVNLEIEPKANITQLVNEGKITITSSDANILGITGQMASPVAAGTATITVKIGNSQDTVEVTLKAQQTVKDKYGVAHEGTAEDPFDNEDACKVAKSDKYNNEDFYVKGVVDRFYYAPGSRTDGSVAYYLKAATEGGEQFEVFKVYKDKEQKVPLTDDDIWVGGTAVAHGQFTVYNGTQAETTSAIFVSCEGQKPEARKTISATFAEVLAAGNALKDSDSTWDFYKFEGYVTVKSGNDYFLTATKGEALVPGKSDEAHGARDIKGTNAIELYGAGKVAELAAKLLEGAKVEVTMTVKNYHGTIENGADLKDADVVVKETGTAWAVPEPAVGARTLAEFIAGENTKAKAYNVTATVKSWKTAEAEKDQFGNMVLTDGENDLTIYGASATATALAWDNSSAYSFSNPRDFLTNEVTAALNIGDEITMKMIRADYNGAVQGSGVITKVTPAGAQTASLEIATSIAVGDKLIMSAEGEHTPQTGDPVPFKKQFNGIIASGSNKIGEAVDYAGDKPVADAAVLEVVAGSEANTFAFKLGEKYLVWKSGNTLDEQDAVDANASWKVTFAEGKASLVNSADAEGKRNLQYNSGSPRFATYASVQKPVTLWKITAPSGGEEQNKEVNVSSVTIAKKDDKVYLNIAGTAKNFAAADFLWALGLEHTGSNSGGDSQTGFIVGKAAFEASDYTLPATLNADGSFLFEFNLSDLATFKAGSYFITAGVKGLADPVAIGTNKPDIELTDLNYRFYFRNDIGNKLTLCADELPPLHLAEASIVTADGKIWAKIGGEVSSEAITQEVLDSYDSFVNFQNTSNWSNTRKTKADGGYYWAKEGTKAYIYIDVTFFTAGGNYNTHLNVKENTQANCKMEVNIDEHYNVKKDETTWLDIEVFSDLTASGSDQSKFWGNLGFKVTKGVDPDAHVHVWGDAQAKVGAATPHACSGCDAIAYELDFADATGGAVNPQKLKQDVAWNINGLPAGTYEIQIYACAASSTLSQNVLSNGVGRYQWRVDDGAYVNPDSGTYSDFGLGTGEAAANCQWSGTMARIEIAAGAQSFEIHWTNNGYSAFIGGVRLISVVA